MSALDRLDWVAGSAFRVFGVRIGIRSDDEDLFRKLTERLPPGARPIRARDVDVLYSARRGSALATSPAPFFLLDAGDAAVTRTPSESDLLDAFEGHARVEVAGAARRWTIVHAGVVGWRGRAIVLPGASHDGKSELVAALVTAGATYYSDEYAVFDARGRVHPFRKPLTLRPRGGRPARRVPVSELGADGHAPGLPLGLVVATRYEPGAGTPDIRCSAAEALMALLARSGRARLDPGRTLRTLARATATAAGLRGPRGEAEPVAATLLRYAQTLFPAPAAGPDFPTAGACRAREAEVA